MKTEWLLSCLAAMLVCQWACSSEPGGAGGNTGGAAGMTSGGADAGGAGGGGGAGIGGGGAGTGGGGAGAGGGGAGGSPGRDAAASLDAGGGAADAAVVSPAADASGSKDLAAAPPQDAGASTDAAPVAAGDAGPSGPVRQVMVGNFFADPKSLTIKVGDVVKFVNVGGSHNVVSVEVTGGVANCKTVTMDFYPLQMAPAACVMIDGIGHGCDGCPAKYVLNGFCMTSNNTSGAGLSVTFSKKGVFGFADTRNNHCAQGIKGVITVE